MITALLILILTSVATAIPIISLPINAQVPPVARANERFSFIFSDSTFSTSVGAIVYNISNGPGWLQLDSSKRTFFGTPNNGDSGSCSFNLIAKDADGSTTIPVTFIVTTDLGPGLGTPVAEQLSTQNGFSSPDSLLISHSSPFSLTFSPDTFTNTNEHTVYYAFSANHTPLPSWIHFVPNNLSFSGITPQATSLAELPQTFALEVTASNVLGFADAVATFQVIVERHLFTFTNNLHVINTTSGSQIYYNGLQNDLSLSGRKANSTDIAQVANNAPSWVSVANESLVVSGTVPKSVPRQNFTINVTDIYGETATTTVLILSEANNTKTLLAPMGTLMAKTGCDFQYDLHAILNHAEAAVYVSFEATASWLSYDPSTLKLTGTVPTNLGAQSIEVNVSAATGSQTQSGNLTIMVVPSNNSVVSTPTHNAISTPGTFSTASESGSRIQRDKRWIALIVVLPIFMIMLSLCIIFFVVRKRRKAQEEWETDSSPSSKGSVVHNEKTKEHKTQTSVEMSGALGTDHDRPSSKISLPPTIDVPGLWKTVTGNRGIQKHQSKISIASGYPASRRDSWNSYAAKLNARPNSSTVHKTETIEEERPLPRSSPRHQSNKSRPDFPRFSVSSNSYPSHRYSRSRQTRSNLSFGSSALLSSHMSGCGHGRSIRSQGSIVIPLGTRGIGHGDGRGPPGFGTVRDSWRNFRILKMLANADGSSSESEIFRQCSSTQQNRMSTPKGHDKTSIRLVSTPSTRASPKKSAAFISESARPSTAQRNDQLKRLQDFHRKRVLLKNSERAFFAAGTSGSRVSSYGSAKATETPTRHLSNSKARLSPRRRPYPSNSANQSLGVDTEILTEKDKHAHIASELSGFEASRNPPTHRPPSPPKSSNSPLRRQPHQPSSINQIRLPLIGRSSRKNSVMSDDLDSRWESASSDAASMDPYMYSRDLYSTRDQGSEEHRPRSAHSQPAHRGKRDEPYISPTRSTTRIGLERFTKSIKRLSYGRAEREESTSDEGEEHRGRNRTIRVGGPPGRSVFLGQGVGKGDPGNTSFQGDITTGLHDHSEGDEESAFV